MTLVSYKIGNETTKSYAKAKAIAKQLGAEIVTIFTTVPDNYFMTCTSRETIPQALKRLSKYPCIWQATN